MKKKCKPITMLLRETWNIKPTPRIKASGKLYSRKKYKINKEP